MSDRRSLQQRFGALSPDQVSALDQAAIASGVDVVQLMEIAGLQTARCAWDMLGGAADVVRVVAGHGNNGGDGVVAARMLATWGCQVLCHLLLGDRPLDGLLQQHVHAAEACGVGVTHHRHPAELEFSPSALVVDAVLGTGLRSAPRGLAGAAIRAVNQLGTAVLSVDVPSGFDAATGEAYQPCVRATRTCTLAAVKAGMWRPEAAPHLGDLYVADIGMPAAAWRSCGLEPPDEVTAGRLLPVPSATRE